jgi:imidazolonepropionase-like amidohydrolase
MLNRWTRGATGALLSALLLTVITAGAGAQENSFALTGGTVVTVTGPTIEGGIVLVQDGRIAGVGADVTVPAGVRRIDVSGLYVYPGLIDAGTGVGLQEAGGMSGPMDRMELGDYNPHLEAYIAVNQDSEILEVQRVGGFTTVVTGLSSGIISGYDSLINLWGWTPQAMTVERRIGLRVNWPTSMRQGVSRADQIKNLKLYFREAQAYATRQRLVAEGTLAGMERDIRIEGLVPAATGETTVFLEANRERDIRDAVAMAEELGLDYVLRGAQDAWKMLDFLKEHEVRVLFSNVHGSPGRDQPYDVYYATPAILHNAGIDFALYSNTTANTFSLTYPVGMSVAFGLPMDKALQSVTIDAARMLGVDDRLGSIEEGKIANLIVMTGNPVEYTSQLRMMFIRGEEIPWTDKFSRFYQTYLKRKGEILP